MKNLCVIVNPKARGGEVEKRWPDFQKDIESAVAKQGELKTEVYFTTPEDHGAGIVRGALLAGTRQFLIVGGDGTISAAVQGLYDESGEKALAADGERPEFRVMPAGRGDDFFKTLVGHRSFGPEAGWQAGLEIMATGHAQALDLVRVRWLGGQSEPLRGAHLCVNIGSFGYPGLVVQRVLGHQGFWGKGRVAKSALAYLGQSLAGLLEYKNLETTVSIDGQEFFKGSLFTGVVLNGRYNGGGMCWSDQAQLDDGLVEVVVREPTGPVGAITVSTGLIAGRWEGKQGVHVGRGSKVRVTFSAGETKRHPYFEIDGDLPEPAGTRGAEFEVLPGAARVWVA